MAVFVFNYQPLNSAACRKITLGTLMALYNKWDVKNGFVYVLTFFPLISDGLGGVRYPILTKLLDLSNLNFF